MPSRSLSYLAPVVVVVWLAGCPDETVEDDGNVTTITVSNSSTTTSSTTATGTSTSVSTGEGGQGGLAAGGQGGSQGGTSQGGSSQGGASQGGSSQGGSSQGGAGQGGGMCVATVSGDPTCDSCLTGYCCTEAATCQGNPTQCLPLYSCAVNSCINNNECIFPICDATSAMLVHEACATCLGTNCCVEFKACENDIDCFDCITGMSPTSCGATTLDDTFEACQMTNCALECVYL